MRTDSAVHMWQVAPAQKIGEDIQEDTMKCENKIAEERTFVERMPSCC